MGEGRGLAETVLWISVALLAGYAFGGCSPANRAGARADRRTSASGTATTTRVSSIRPNPETGSEAAVTERSAVVSGAVAAEPGQRQPFEIDLPTALRLADANNYKIAMAREKIAEAVARHDRAKALLLPTLSVGTSYHRHEGVLQETSGDVMDVDRSSSYAGLGAGAIGAGAPRVPGVSLTTDLSSAIFEPLAARQGALAARAGDRVVTNEALLDVAVAYYDLVRAKSALVIAEETFRNAEELAHVTHSYADIGEGLGSDAERAAVEKLVREKEREEAGEALLVESARLARLLRLDPRVQLVPIDAEVPIRLVPGHHSQGDLIRTALADHPTLAQKQALVDLALERSRQAKYAPLFPRLSVDYSTGYFEGERSSSTGDTGDRYDLGLMLYWQITNLGVGDHARSRQFRSIRRQAELEQLDAMDAVVSEVVQAFAQVHSRQRQIALAAAAVERASRSLELNRTRVHQRQGLPLEMLQAIQSLATARRLYLDSIISYNQAQFRLYTAMGQPPREALSGADTSPRVPPILRTQD